MNATMLATTYTTPLTFYTRKQALELGSLKDISRFTCSFDLKFPTAMTDAAWRYLIDNDDYGNQRQIEFKLRELCFMLSSAFFTKVLETTQVFYFPFRVDSGKNHISATLKVVISSRDNLQPVMTVMLPDEEARYIIW
ncbi:DUF6573 family protein [Priestia filamentosa]|uniref:DUF6573 family protein n=1 Tax=Priestia filamentosa TaxID=1402861 RepID=UPI0039822B2D